MYSISNILRYFTTTIANCYALVYPSKRYSSLIQDITLPTPAYIQKDNIISIYNKNISCITHTLYALKNERSVYAAQLIATSIHTALVAHAFSRDISIVPIPSSTKRYGKRGYDHMRLVCECLSVYGYTIDTILLTRGSVHEQKTLHRKDRLQNIKNMFVVDSLPTHTTVVLIDDVITTRATMRGAMRAVVDSGSYSVMGVAFARSLLTYNYEKK